MSSRSRRRLFFLGLNSGQNSEKNLMKFKITFDSPLTDYQWEVAQLPFNKRVVSLFQTDDSNPSTHDLLYPFYKGGEVDLGEGPVELPGIYSNNPAGGPISWGMSVACFQINNNNYDILEEGRDNDLDWSMLREMTTGFGNNNPFSFSNHQLGGGEQEQADILYQIQQLQINAFEQLGYIPEDMVRPAAGEGWTAVCNFLGLDITSQNTLNSDGFDGKALGSTAFISDIEASTAYPLYLLRNHWREGNGQFYLEFKEYIDNAKIKSDISPIVFNWFSHGPGFGEVDNFDQYSQVIDYMQTIWGDDVIGLSLQKFLNYIKTNQAISNNADDKNRDVYDPSDNSLTITLDTKGINRNVLYKDISLNITNTDGASIVSIENLSEDTIHLAEAASIDDTLGLVNIFAIPTTIRHPANLDFFIRIDNEYQITIPEEEPDSFIVKFDKIASINTIGGWEIVIEGGSERQIVSVEDTTTHSDSFKFKLDAPVTAFDSVYLNYRMEEGDVYDYAIYRNKLCSYIKLEVLNLSQVLPPEVEKKRISVSYNEADTYTIFASDTISELDTFLRTFNFNSAIFISFNDNLAPFYITERWNINYDTKDYSITIQGIINNDDENYTTGDSTYFPTITSNGLFSDLIRVSCSNVDFKFLNFISGKYSADSIAIGDNYSGAIIAQTSNTHNSGYYYCTFSECLRGLQISGPNSTDNPNIQNINISYLTFKSIVGNSITIGLGTILNSGSIYDINNAEYGIYKCYIDNITCINDQTAQTVIATDENEVDLFFGGRIVIRGAYFIRLDKFTVSNSKQQAVLVDSCKDIYVQNVFADNVSVDAGGYDYSIRATNTYDINIIGNVLTDPTRSSISLDHCRAIVIYRNLIEGELYVTNAREIIYIHSNLAIAKLNQWACTVTFNDDDGYIPSFEQDFSIEEQNMWITRDFRLISVSGIPGAEDMFVYSDYHHPYSEYRTNYNRGLTSDYGYIADFALDAVDKRFLDEDSIGVGFCTELLSPYPLFNPDGGQFVAPYDVGAYSRV